MARFGIGGNYDRYLVMFVHKIADTRIKTVWVSDKGDVANSAGGTGAVLSDKFDGHCQTKRA